MLFLSQCLGLPVREPSGEPIGSIADLIVAIGGKYPPVTGLVLLTDRRRVFMPWRDVDAFDSSGARLRVRTIDIGRFNRRQSEILLKADLLDRQIVDLEGRKVIRVNEVRLDADDGRVRLVGRELGAAGLLRRIGIERPVRRLAGRLRGTLPERYIDWE